MEQIHNNICISSYNSTGFGIGVQSFIKTLALFTDILCIQEHFLLDAKSKTYSNTDKLRKLCSGRYDMFIVPAYKDMLQVSRGRGSGGLATLWDKSLTKYVTKIKCSSYRLQATKFSFPSGSLLLLNTYFPCDPRNNNFDEEEVLALLNEMKQLMMFHSCKHNLILGDLNSHFSRQTPFTSIIEDFFSELNLVIFWDNPDDSEGHLIQAVDYTFQQSNIDACYRSSIDHFVSNSVCYDSVIEAGVLHSGDNPSNHSPIFAKIDLGNFDNKVDSIQQEPRVNWLKSSKEAQENFKDCLKSNLENISYSESIKCKDVHCSSHFQEIESYAWDIMCSVEDASLQCLSVGQKKLSNKSKKIKSTPGWLEHVKSYSEDSKFWCAI